MSNNKSIEHYRVGFEIKAIGTDGTFSGYGSIFGNTDSYNEIVAKGAFARSLKQYEQKKCQPALLWMHDPTQPIGIWTNLSEDEKGLAVEGRLSLKTQKGQEAYELMKMGAVTGLSIGYRVVKSEIDTQRKARVLTDVNLFEVSLVTFPANDAARVDAVKAAESVKTIREFENFLRDAGGYSERAARKIASCGFKAQSDVRDEPVELSELAAAARRASTILQR